MLRTRIVSNRSRRDGDVGWTRLGRRVVEGIARLVVGRPAVVRTQGTALLADTKGGAIFAVDTGDTQPDSAGGPLKVDGLTRRLLPSWARCPTRSPSATSR